MHSYRPKYSFEIKFEVLRFLWIIFKSLDSAQGHNGPPQLVTSFQSSVAIGLKKKSFMHIFLFHCFFDTITQQLHQLWDSNWHHFSLARPVSMTSALDYSATLPSFLFCLKLQKSSVKSSWSILDWRLKWAHEEFNQQNKIAEQNKRTSWQNLINW